MSTIRDCFSRVLGLLFPRRGDERLDEEIRMHLDLLADEYAARGMPPEAARLAARRAFGGVDQMKEACRDQRGLPLVDTCVQDVRFAARMMRRDPWFAVTAVAVLGLGIGVNNMFFTILHAHTMRGLPMHRADRVVAITLSDARTPDRGISRADFEIIRERARGLTVAAFTTGPMILAEGGRAPERFAGAFASAGTFGLIGARPVLGRDFGAEDDRPGAPAAALLSEAAWHSRYGGDTGIIDRTILVNGRHADVVGVMPDRSGFPGTADVWLPLSQLATRAASPPEADGLQLFARLQDDASVADARAELDAIAATLARDHPETHAQVRAHVNPINERYLGRLRDPAWLAFMAAGCLIVLISCANVAILLLGRSAGRSREIAIRASLGASRGRVVRQLLVEGATLAGLGGLAGLAVSVAAVRLFASAIPEHVLPYWLDYTLDARVLVALIGVSGATIFFFALAPAVHSSRLDITRVLNAGSQYDGGRSGRRWVSIVLAAEIALAVVLLAHLAVNIRTSTAPLPAERAIAIAGIVTAALSLPAETYPIPDEQHRLYRELTERLTRLPGTSASVASRLPLTGAERQRVLIDGATPPDDPPALVPVVALAPRYFATLGLSLLRGREFDGNDGPPGRAHAIVNERFVEQFLTDREPLGQQITLRPPGPPGDEGSVLTIVGVSQDIRQRPSVNPDPVVYVPHRAAPAPDAMLLVRSSMERGALLSLVRGELQALDRYLPLYRTQTMAQVMRDAEWNGRVSRRLMAFLTFIAVALAMAGLFTAAARSLMQRTPEIGLRMALGARRRHIARMILTRTALQLAAGFAAGVACTRLWEWVFPSGSASATTDPESLLIVAGILGTAGLLASVVPVRRATRLDPIAALRQH